MTEHDSITFEHQTDAATGFWCETCLARSAANDRCVSCEKLSKLEQETFNLNQRNVQILADRNALLEKTVKLQMVIDDLSQRLYEQVQSFKQMNLGLREKEREREIWKRHATRQENRLREVKSIVRSLHDRRRLEPEYCEILMDVIDQAKVQDEKVSLPSQDFKTTTGSVDLMGSTVKIINHALFEMSLLVDDEKILKLCGSRDRVVFVDWMIGKSSAVD